MFKFTSNGFEEFGEVLELTEEDRSCILNDIGEKTSDLGLKRVNGIWRQSSSLDLLENGYRIYEKDEPDRLRFAEHKDAIDILCEDLDKAKRFRQIRGIQPCLV